MLQFAILNSYFALHVCVSCTLAIVWDLFFLLLLLSFQGDKILAPVLEKIEYTFTDKLFSNAL